LNESAKELLDVAAEDGVKLKITDLKYKHGDYNMDVLLRAASQAFDLTGNEEPVGVQFENEDMILSIMETSTDLLLLEDDNHWLTWRKDERTGLWWDLNSQHSPKCYSYAEAATELIRREVLLFDCTAWRKKINVANLSYKA
jgi:hypothetical protein